MPKLRVLAALSSVCVAVSACAPMATLSQPAPWQVAGSAQLQDGRGNKVGTAELRQRGQEWALAIGISGQTPGEHGIHLHAVGLCNAPDFTSAKGHLNPAGKAHGTANPGGAHMGDLPNLLVAPDGTASTVIAMPAPLDPTALFDTDGTAVVVHAGPDDYRSDPAGNSGARVACGVFVPA